MVRSSQVDTGKLQLCTRHVCCSPAPHTHHVWHCTPPPSSQPHSDTVPLHSDHVHCRELDKGWSSNPPLTTERHTDTFRQHISHVQRSCWGTLHHLCSNLRPVQTLVLFPRHCRDQYTRFPVSAQQTLIWHQSCIFCSHYEYIPPSHVLLHLDAPYAFQRLQLTRLPRWVWCWTVGLLSGSLEL